MQRTTVETCDVLYTIWAVNPKVEHDELGPLDNISYPTLNAVNRAFDLAKRQSPDLQFAIIKSETRYSIIREAI